MIVIPARWASTRFPGKPLAPIAGVSLIQRVYERVAKSGASEAVFVATDDTRIADHVREFRGNVVQPGGDFHTGTDRIVNEQIPLRRLGNPEEVAKAIYFLCTDQSSYVHGAELHINGGQHV